MTTRVPLPQSQQQRERFDMDNAHRGDAGRDADGVEFSGDQSHKNIRQLEKESKAAPGKKQKANKKDDSALTVLCAWIVENQIGLAVNLLLLHALTHLCFPRARQHTRKFFELAYFSPPSGRYALGRDDMLMVLYWIIVFTGLRATVMDYLLVPLAQQFGIGKRKEKVRFAEQAWILIYYGVFWSLGMYLMYNSDYWFKTRQLWVNWPDREMNSLLKWYYLVQFAFWIQQILVVNIEERRKDHLQMFTHHIITCALISTSYCYHQTKVGNVILCVMDVVDILLPLAKILKYLKYKVACDVAFGIFMVTWFITRHILFLRVCYSLYAENPEETLYGCYRGPSSDLLGPFEPPDRFEHLTQPFRDPKGLVCWNHTIRWIFLTMLLSLQAILLVWGGMIVGVAWKVVKGGEAEDSRSDEEEECEEVTEDEGTHKGEPLTELPPLEKEVGVEAINLSSRKSSPGRRFRKAAGTSSGVTLHSDRKELLGRIGCDKGV